MGVKSLEIGDLSRDVMRFTPLELHGPEVGDGVASRRNTEALLAEDEGWMLGW